MTAATTLGLTAGTWNIDPVHSAVNFSVRHLMVSKVKGQFKEFAGQLVVADEIEGSSVTAAIQTASVDTGNADRDNHLKTADFFNAETNATIDFASTGVTADGSDWKVAGDLTINGVTKPVVLDVEFGGVAQDGYGGTKAGFEAKTDISRGEFGIEFNIPMEGGGVVIGDKITITLDIQAALAA